MKQIQPFLYPCFNYSEKTFKRSNLISHEIEETIMIKTKNIETDEKTNMNNFFNDIEIKIKLHIIL